MGGLCMSVRSCIVNQDACRVGTKLGMPWIIYSSPKASTLDINVKEKYIVGTYADEHISAPAVSALLSAAASTPVAATVSGISQGHRSERQTMRQTVQRSITQSGATGPVVDAVTFDVSQLPIGWLKLEASWNIEPIVVT